MFLFMVFHKVSRRIILIQKGIQVDIRKENAVPKALKMWLLSAIPICVVLVVTAFINWNYALGIILSFWRSEGAMLFWMGRIGLSQLSTLCITVLCSSISIVNYSWLGEQCERPIVGLLKKIKGWCRNIFDIHTQVIACKNGGAATPGKARSIARKFPYFVVPFYAFDLFLGVPSGVLSAKSLKLNPKVTCGLLLFGNLLEKIIWSYLVRGVTPRIQHILMPVLLAFFVAALTAAFVKFLYAADDDGQ